MRLSARSELQRSWRLGLDFAAETESKRAGYDAKDFIGVRESKSCLNRDWGRLGEKSFPDTHEEGERRGGSR